MSKNLDGAPAAEGRQFVQPKLRLPLGPATTLIWAAGLSILTFAFSVIFTPFGDLAAFYLYQEDRWLLVTAAMILCGMSLWQPTDNKGAFPDSRWLPIGVAVLLVPICLAGHRWILAGYNLSRDEQLASFDAIVFASGHWVQTIPVLWRDHADTLNTLFMYPASHRGAWISAYLPVNAGLRALVGIVATPALTEPLMTAVAAGALWGCARRIWPQDHEAPVVALLLFVSSGQVLVTGMTAYAMPAHLAFNLVWLWLFLRRAWWTDIAALAVGFGAVGLHQPLPHLMFVGPLLLLLLLERQWSRAIFYAAGYGAIGIFWLWWPGWTWSLVQAYPNAQPPAGVDFISRLKAAVAERGSAGPLDMIANLLRFVAWQSPALIPLMLIGWKMVRHSRIGAALLGGVLLTTVAMAIIVPFQGHGFGYRYLHGLIGNCILLAVFGWASLDRERGVWRGWLLRVFIAEALILLPLQLWMAHAIYTPAEVTDARIAAIKAEYVVIGSGDAPYAHDLVYNPPMLDRRPLRLAAETLDNGAIAALCRTRPQIVLAGDRLFDRMNAYFWLAPQHIASRRNRHLEPRLSLAGCRVAVLP